MFFVTSLHPLVQPPIVPLASFCENHCLVLVPAQRLDYTTCFHVLCALDILEVFKRQFLSETQTETSGVEAVLVVSPGAGM